MAGVEQSLVRIETTLADNLPKVTKQLYGNGSPKDPGMIVRLDRLEQSSIRTRWVLRAVIVIVLSGVWSLLTG